MIKNLPCVCGQKIQIGNDVVIEFFELNGQIKMNICVPKYIEVHQKELYDMMKFQIFNEMDSEVTRTQLFTASNKERVE